MVEEKASSDTRLSQAVRDGGGDGRALGPRPLLGLSVVMISESGAEPAIGQLIYAKQGGMSAEPMETFLRLQTG